jgi:hypothetical protein
LNVVVVTGSRETDTVERCEGFGACYVREGPGFWNGLDVALTGLFPSMVERIKELQPHSIPVNSLQRCKSCAASNITGLMRKSVAPPLSKGVDASTPAKRSCLADCKAAAKFQSRPSSPRHSVGSACAARPLRVFYFDRRERLLARSMEELIR